MNNLTVINNKTMVIDSREIAEMMGVNHWEILRKLEGTEKVKGIIPTLTDNKIVVSDYFIKSSYKDESGKENKCYLFTKLGCEFIANKFTGEKGILFTAKYVKRFNDMEQQIKGEASTSKSISTSEDKKKLAEARYNNSLVRKANILLKLADKDEISKEYKQVLYSYATAIIADKPLLPLPEMTEPTLTAEEVGKRLGITANMVGRIAKGHNLKTEQYGKWFHDKSRYSNKEVQSFRYYESVIPVIKAILSREVLS